ncbi:MAG: MFS transporter [Alphaproteobacteria bacterium]|nr:MFS transporter [Alphaproteobacteria bacterium]
MSRVRLAAWIMWMTASIFYAYQYVLRVMPNIMLTDIMEAFQMDAAVFGQFASFYYMGYAFLHLPIGLMLDRVGPRKVMTGCILLTVVGMSPLLWAEHAAVPIVGRLLIGIGSSAAILGTFKIIRMVFQEKHFTRMLSFSVTIGLMGAIYGGGPVKSLCDTMGYQSVIEILSVMGIVLAAITYFVVPEQPKTVQPPVINQIKTVITNRKVWAVCLCAGFMLGPLEGFADVWGAEFLKKIYNMEAIIASYLTSLVFVGMCFGAPVLSFIAEKSGRYMAAICGAGVTMFGVFTFLMSGRMELSTMAISFTMVGVCCAYQIIAIYKASTYVPESAAGLTTAVANMIIMLFGSAFHSVIGMVVNTLGGVGSEKAFLYGVGVIPVTLGVGVLGFAIMAYQEAKKMKSQTEIQDVIYV